MPRLRPLERADAPADALPYYALDEERYGAVLNNTMLYAYNVPVLKAMKAVVAASEALRRASVALAPLRWIADSVYVSAERRAAGG